MENTKVGDFIVIHFLQVIGQPAAVPPSDHPPSPAEAAPSQPSQLIKPEPAALPPEPLASPAYLPPAESTIDLEGSFSWALSYLEDPNFKGVPVSCFKHVSW